MKEDSSWLTQVLSMRWLLHPLFTLSATATLALLGLIFPGFGFIPEQSRDKVELLVTFCGLALTGYQSIRQTHDDHVRVTKAMAKSINNALTRVEAHIQMQADGAYIERLGSDDKALRYVLQKFVLPEAQPKLIRVRDTHVRQERYRPYPQSAYDALEHGFREFLRRGDTDAELVVGWKRDEKYLMALQGAVGGLEKANLECYQLRRSAPLMNFIILEHEGGLGNEVLFGWGEHEPDAAVFRSTDKRVVAAFGHFYDTLKHDSVSQTVPVHKLTEPASKAKESISFRDEQWQWQPDRLYPLLKTIKRGDEGKEQEEKGDIRIVTGSFLDFQHIRGALAKLFEKRVRVKILLMNPDNSGLMNARYGVREDDRTVDKVWAELKYQIPLLTDETTEKNIIPTERALLEVLVSDIMPCGYVVQTDEWALLGLMPAHYSYLVSPLIEVPSDSELWRMLDADWKARWTAAKRSSKLESRSFKTAG